MSTEVQTCAQPRNGDGVKASRRLPRSARSRIRRRAHALAKLAYDDLIDRLAQDIEDGELALADIESWQP